ncbi:MAG: hypothetical protein J6B79_04545 [Clostridia bacterium]|nr:hypothetical protein [Clostridia bacterium]
MKKMKLREKIMLMFSLALVSILFLVPTFSKYVAQTTAPFGDEEDLDYTVNSVFEVKSQNELFAAINQGYTYVQLSKDIENPLIVTEQAKDLNSDLIIDLNGIEIQRNGHDPILNIKENIRLTVVDTSTEQTGGLYNPIGSVFNLEGGTLTVVTGTFESGPRYSEYYSYNHQVLNGSSGSTTKRTLVDPAQEVKFYTNSGQTVVTKTAPIIRSYPTVTGEITYNHGNLYFDHEVTGGNHTIKPDTYCYYRTSEDEAATANDPATADWYYTYWVDENHYEYVSAEKPTDTDSKYIQVFIYGYENTIDGASKITAPKDFYAAIQMQSGKIEVQNGDFFSYFGVNTTACVNANGGVIDVKKGNFSSRIPNAEYYTNYGVAIKEKDSLAFGTSYFNNYNWANEEFTGGAIARKGESFCILNSGESEVSIGEGNCYSSNNNIISMQGGGSLSIGGGTFTKKNTIELSTNSDTRAPAIYMKEGQLDISNTNYDIYGKYASAIYMLDGKMTVNNSTYNIDGSNTIGIYSAVAGDDNFIVNDTDFTLTNGDNQNGIIAVNGKVQVSSSGTNEIETDGANGVGIYVSDGGSVSSTNYTYTLDGTNSKGILAESDAAGIDVTGGKFTITGDNSFGIESLISGDDKFNVTDADITMTGGTKQTGIYSANGRVNVKSTSAATISIAGAEGKGIHVANGGSVSSNGYSYTLQDDNSYGIYAIDGDVGVVDGNFDLTGENQIGIYANNGDVNVNSSSADITVTGANGKGIHVENGGSVTSTNYAYTLNGASSKGIYAATDALSINVTGGQFNIQGNSSFGIESFLSGTDKFTVTNANITMTNGTAQTGIYSANGRVNVKSTSAATISIAGAEGKGIHVANGGSVSSTNYAYTLNGATSYGIYSEGGLIQVSGGDIELKSNVACYGIYAVDTTYDSDASIKNPSLEILIDNANIEVGFDETDNKSGTVQASIGVLLETNNIDNYISLENTTISCFEVGVSVGGGYLDISGSGGINTKKASAIVVNGGSITIDESSNFAITSSNTRSEYNENATTYHNNIYNITIPRLNGTTINNVAYQNTDGIYVSGGSFSSNGQVSITHTGLQNSTDYDDYTGVVINSYAVRVLGGSVDILRGAITAVAGGGIYAGEQDGVLGSITMGNSSTTRDQITVKANGNTTNDETYDAIGTWISNGWTNEKSVTGGHAIELAGGSITIWEGYYEAQFGNGVAANSSGNINIYNGEFYGWMNDSDGDMIPNGTNNSKSGPSAHYGLKVIGGATVNIFNGMFDGGNGGAFVTGIDEFNSRYDIDGSLASVYIYKGIFGGSGKGAKALDGFNVYDYSRVIFGAYRATGSAVDAQLITPFTTKEEYNNAIVINATNATIATNPITDSTTKISSDVYVYYGNYDNNSNTGVWNANGTIRAYNTSATIGYTIYKGAGTLQNNNTAQFYA